MSERGYDPQCADRSVRELAELTDARQVADIRAAVVAALKAWDAWRVSPDWTRDGVTDRIAAVVEQVRAGLAGLPADAGLDAVVDTVAGPLLGLWWPTHPPAAARTAAAVETLRYLAAKRPRLVADCRRLLAPADRDAKQPAGS